MRRYTDDEERTIRAGRLARDWMQSGLIDAAQYARLLPGLSLALRRTNVFLRVILFGFGLVIVAAAVGLVAVTADVKTSSSGAAICFGAAGAAACLAELLVGRFRFYRFGIEEACVAAAVILIAVGSALAAGWLTDQHRIMLALVSGAAAAFVAYRRFGYWYAAIAAMACAALAPFELAQSPAVQRTLAALTLAGCAAVARIKHRHYGEEYPGDEYGALHAAAVLGAYVVLNLQISSPAPRAMAASFYWLTYVMIWIVPALGLLFALRERSRWLLDASLVMALATVATNKPYIGLQHREWDPVLLGALLIGAALILRRWLAAGPRGMRHGITASRILRSEKDRIALVGLASGFHDAPAGVHSGVAAPNPFGGDGGRAGGGGADGSF